MALVNRETNEPTSHNPLRLWPGVVIVALQWLSRFVVPLVVPEAVPFGVIAGIVGGLAVLVWWLFFSRAPWSERGGAIVLMVVALLATKRIVHPSIANGMMGMMLPIDAIPILSLALVTWAVASRRLSSGLRRASLIGAIVLACGVMTLVRTGGVTGNGVSDLHWRWAQTPEERLLAEASKPASSRVGRAPAAPTSAPTAAATPQQPRLPQPVKEPLDSARGGPMALAANPAGANTNAQWPSFRGPQRDGIVRGIQIATDWSRSAPVELWRRPIGPGWSSFAVDGKLLWNHPWKSDGIVQPAVLAGGDVLIGSGSGLDMKVGLRRVAAAHGPAGWTTEERWTSIGLKPYFNDFVVHKGHAYGFDGGTLACIDLEDGGRKWKGGRYGHGQLLLLADQDLLLVLSEEGELALVKAAPEAFIELARFPAIKGKTWNHPVLAGDILLVRNGEEMAAFRLALKGGFAAHRQHNYEDCDS